MEMINIFFKSLFVDNLALAFFLGNRAAEASEDEW